MSFLSGFFGATQTGSLASAKSVLDVVTGMAALASNPQDIDPLLDDVRAITARLKPGEEPSAADETALLKVYMRLEAYLTTKEPIRTFTKDDLRKRLSSDMRARIDAYEGKG